MRFLPRGAAGREEGGGGVEAGANVLGGRRFLAGLSSTVVVDSRRCPRQSGVQMNRRKITQVRTDITKEIGGVSGQGSSSPLRKQVEMAAENTNSDERILRPGGMVGVGVLGEKERRARPSYRRGEGKESRRLMAGLKREIAGRLRARFGARKKKG